MPPKKDSKARKEKKTEAKPRRTPEEIKGQIFADLQDLSLDDRIGMAKAACGLAGMIALFPSQIEALKSKRSGPKTAQDQSKEKKKTPAEQKKNPLKDTEAYKAFQQARKLLIDTAKERGVEKLDSDDPVTIAYSSALDAWNSFREEHAPKKGPSNGPGAKTDDKMPSGADGGFKSTSARAAPGRSHTSAKPTADDLSYTLT